MGLIKYSTADYVIFCDQDDIWFEKKLEILVDFAEKNFDTNTPCLVYCDAYGYSDAEGVIIFDGVSRAHARSLSEFLFFNGGYLGCSTLFNKRLCLMASDYRADYYYLHDDVVSLLAHSFGCVYFLPKKLMLYRQHASNVTTGNVMDLHTCLRRSFNSKLYVLSAKHYKEKKAFYIAYEDDLDDDAKRLFAAYLDFPNVTLFKRILLIILHGFSLGGSRLKLLIKTIIRRPIG
jgi:rhamnosyltransferase